MGQKKTPARQTKTIMLTTKDIKRNWFKFDAEGETLGRFATKIATILRGKHKPTFTPHVDGGDAVVITNARKIKVTGNKEAQKVYRHHTGFPGGLREVPYAVVKDRNPAFILMKAVKGMLPKTKQGRAQLKRLRVFAEEQHNQKAQQPIDVKN